jgi:hypothetical protein
MAQQHERPFPVSKDALDTLNSISWFLMDAFWMLEKTSFGKIFVLPTIVSGLLLLYIEKRRTVFWINLAINSWIWMNTFWMFERLPLARVSFGFGLLCVFAAILEAKSLRETFSHFRRFRILNLR